jgi:hypothetical protein
MKTRFPRIFRARNLQSGQAAGLMLSAFTLTVLLGASAFGTDLASYYYNAFILQNAVDASVLSGAKYLPCQSSGGGTNNSTSVATTIGTADWLRSSELSGQPTFSNTGTAPTCQGGGSGYNTIQMTATRTVPFYFGRAVGVNQGTVSVCAKAEVGGVSGINHPNLWVGLQDCGSSYSTCTTPYHVGEPMALTDGHGANGWPDASGDWGPLTPTQSLSLGQTVTGNPGNGNQGNGNQCGNQCEANKAQALIDAAMSNSTYSSDTATNFVAGDPRLVVVPLVDWSGCTSGGRSCTLTILGFAQVFITAVTRGGNSDSIQATFVADGVPGTFSSSVQCTGPGAQDVGACGIKLFNC